MADAMASALSPLPPEKIDDVAQELRELRSTCEYAEMIIERAGRAHKDLDRERTTSSIRMPDDPLLWCERFEQALEELQDIELPELTKQAAFADHGGFRGRAAGYHAAEMAGASASLAAAIGRCEAELAFLRAPEEELDESMEDDDGGLDIVAKLNGLNVGAPAKAMPLDLGPSWGNELDVD